MKTIWAGEDSFSPFASTTADALHGILFAFDPATNKVYQLGFDRTTSPFTAIWVEAGTWIAAKSRWGTWDIARAEATTWLTAKELIGGLSE